MDAATTVAAVALYLSLLWIFVLLFDRRRRINEPGVLAGLRLFSHVLPSLFLLGTALAARTVRDTALVWFIALFVFRYWRTLVSVWYWFQYQPAIATTQSRFTSKNCTVIVSTVGPRGNAMFENMVTSILFNRPAHLIFSTNSDDAKTQVTAALSTIQLNIANVATSYQEENGLSKMPARLTTKIEVVNANMSNKRQQVVHALNEVTTEIVVIADDTVMWHPRFLATTLPAFDSEKVGLVGTRKWVMRFAQSRDRRLGLFNGLWKQYAAGFWNCMGGLYLVRHNFETRASNAADGGVFCVSGRTSLMLADIVCGTEFKQAFTNEYLLRFGDIFPGWGPVIADDDNFITRWVINHNWSVKIQSSEQATITTVLGTYPLKFPDQCQRWSRTTFRQNPIALFIDRTIWWKWPLTVWTTYFPWLYNAALIWDSLAVYTLTCTKCYTSSSHKTTLISSFICFIWMVKLIKTCQWFRVYPADFILYFVIPAYPLFVYWHSLLKIYTAFTFWDLAWSGRKLD